jgi:prevent-host-death family protein
MVTAGIKELKNQLSRYIGLVKKGDDVLVTERGRVIARIVKEDSSSSSLRQALQPLILKGQVIYACPACPVAPGRWYWGGSGRSNGVPP